MKSFFEIKEYTLEHINSLITNNAEESLYLEFKEAGALRLDEKSKTEISKDISAFANSDGGVIIYGLGEKDRVANKITYIDSTKFSKDWLQQIIESRISRQLNLIEIQPINNPNNTTEQIWVVKIQASPQAPHMSYDNHYYRRNNAGNVLMEEYEVREKYYRTGQTDLIINGITGSIGDGHHPHEGKPTSIHFNLKFYIENIGASIEHYYKLEIKIPVQMSQIPQLNYKKNWTIRTDGPFEYYTFKNTSSLFQNETDELAWIEIYMNPTTCTQFIESQMQIKLYYSNGAKEHNFIFKDELFFEGRSLECDMMNVINRY